MLVRKLTVPPDGLPGVATVIKPIGKRHRRKSDRAFCWACGVRVARESGTSCGETIAIAGREGSSCGLRYQPAAAPDTMVMASKIVRPDSVLVLEPAPSGLARRSSKLCRSLPSLSLLCILILRKAARSRSGNGSEVTPSSVASRYSSAPNGFRSSRMVMRR